MAMALAAVASASWWGRPRWVKPFVVVNGFVVGVAWLARRLEVALAESLSLLPPFLGALLACFAACVVRDACVVVFLEGMTRERSRIGGRPPPSPGAARRAWLRLLVVAAPVDAVVLRVAVAWGLVGGARGVVAPPVGWSPLAFVARSFCFEVVFDLFHYATHRFCHACARPAARAPSAARVAARVLHRGHSTHHGSTQHAGLGPVLAYEQSLVDVLFCNAGPALAALACLRAAAPRPVAPWDAGLLWAYKAYVEVAGHSGCHSRATSFPQCVWLPRLLGIALRTTDHDAHHTHAKACNFAKRFTLWDRAFGTYLPEGADQKK